MVNHKRGHKRNRIRNRERNRIQTLPRSSSAEVSLLLFMLLMLMIARCERIRTTPKENPMNKIVHSSESTMWETPQDFFDMVDSVFHFTTDVCAVAKNAKCKHYYSPKTDGLQQRWKGRCWMNPPYGRDVGMWIEKAWQESRMNCLVVALLPVRTDTNWFHQFIYNQRRVAVKFIRGRLKFGGSEDAAPFPSMLVIFGE